MCVILEGEDSTTTLMRVEVMTTGIHFEIFQGEKGMVRITLSEEKWVLLENHINVRCEELHELKEKVKKGRMTRVRQWMKEKGESYNWLV